MYHLTNPANPSKDLVTLRGGLKRDTSRRDPLFKFRNNAQLAAQLAASISHAAVIGPN
jgi:hypothetical protein